MGQFTWGLLGPESLASERRARTLGLGACVRAFNDLAVPGFGGIWFGKQLLLATLGVEVATQIRRAGKRASNIEVANAVEALGCWLALNNNGWRSDPRLRGASKMRPRKSVDLKFSKVRKPSFYVTQPMRQATLQPLRAFGLVEASGERFNGFTCTDMGLAFIEEASRGYQPHRRSVLDHLVRWAKDDGTSINSSDLRDCLSPIQMMPSKARDFLEARAKVGDSPEAKRRENAFRWIDDIKNKPESNVDWQLRPTMLDEEHWKDLHAGAMFFQTRDAAILLLDQIETWMGIQSDQRLRLTERKLSQSIRHQCNELRTAASSFIEKKHDPSPDSAALGFCNECNEKTDAQIIKNLVTRDGRVLLLKGDDVLPGPAFKGNSTIGLDTARSSEEAGEEVIAPDVVNWPLGISRRIRNLFLFHLDMNGELNDWLQTTSSESDS